MNWQKPGDLNKIKDPAIHCPLAIDFYQRDFMNRAMAIAAKYAEIIQRIIAILAASRIVPMVNMEAICRAAQYALAISLQHERLNCIELVLIAARTRIFAPMSLAYRP